METVDGTREPVGTSDRLGVRGWLVLITLCSAQALVGLDFSIVTVALPEIGRDLHFTTTSDLQWVMTACVLPTASLLLLFGRVADLVGRRRLFVAGLAVLTAFCLVAGLATEPWTLVAARAGQGLGAAMVGPTALTLLTSSFPEGPRRTRALGVNGALLSLGFVVGTIGGGLITNGLNWRWTMLILFVIGTISLVGAVTLLPRSDDRGASRLDVPGAALITAGLLALVYGFSTGGANGWTSARTLASLGGGAVLVAAFLLVEGRRREPLIAPAMLNRRTIKWAGLIGFITFGMCGGTTVLLSLYMQDVLDCSPLTTGFGFITEGVAAIVAGTVASRLIGRIGTGRALVAGLTVQAASTAGMVLLPTGGNLALLLLTSGGLGFGHVVSVVSFITTMTSGLRGEEQGAAGGLAQTAQFLGTTVGVAALAAVVSTRTTGTAASDVLTGLHDGLLTAALITLVGAGTALILLRATRARTR
ncbi:MFS transporter [Actinomadura meridiana]|uniref:MFS transporter n=1 Tax=Actinomadura meridiana TaxID=559626 RepID=A0ABP8C8C0_9ACTN